MYATLGDMWTYGSRITYSFVPDGTDIGGQPSSLHQAMAARGFSTQVWQDEFNRAAAVWQAVAGINLSPVPDSGDRISVSGNQQGDPRFGDIRISGIDLGAGSLGMAFYPPPFNGGTIAGDIVMNTAIAWNINSSYDLRTVAIHEIGHALGMDHSTITSAAMFGGYTGIKQTLTSDDTTGIRSIYGAQPNDVFEPNNLPTAPTILSAAVFNANQQVTLAGLNISSSGDNDWFRVTVPAGTSGTMTVRMQTEGLSLVSPKVGVYTTSLQLLGGTTVNSTTGGTATVTISGVSAGQTYLVRAIPNAGAIAGAYALQINAGSGTQAPVPPPNTVVPEQLSSWANPGSGNLTTNSRIDKDKKGDRGDKDKKEKKDKGDDIVRLGNLFGAASILLTDHLDGPGKAIVTPPRFATDTGQAPAANLIVLGSDVFFVRVNETVAAVKAALADPEAIDAVLAAWDSFWSGSPWA
jgi:hypothetical protein